MEKEAVAGRCWRGSGGEVDGFGGRLGKSAQKEERVAGEQGRDGKKGARPKERVAETRAGYEKDRRLKNQARRKSSGGEQ